jgi:hypothetical protein
VVFNRWISRHRVGQVVLGYLVDTGIAGVGGFLVPKPKLSTAFRVTSIDTSFAQVMVEPVVLADDPGCRELGPADMDGPADRWLATGPRFPVRIGMNIYRRALAWATSSSVGKTSPPRPETLRALPSSDGRTSSIGVADRRR